MSRQQKKGEPLSALPFRKFAILDRRSIVGRLLQPGELEDYHHVDLVTALQERHGLESPDFAATGWIYGEGSEVQASAAPLAGDAQDVLAMARDVLGEWASFTGCRVSVELVEDAR
jgi:hypothetical protein